MLVKGGLGKSVIDDCQAIFTSKEVKAMQYNYYSRCEIYLSVICERTEVLIGNGGSVLFARRQQVIFRLTGEKCPFVHNLSTKMEWLLSLNGFNDLTPVSYL